jgi:hypothetical protein
MPAGEERREKNGGLQEPADLEISSGGAEIL